MRFLLACLLALHFLCPTFAQQEDNGPTSEKAQKSYREGLQLLREGREGWALEAFKKADKQDDGHCFACQRQVINAAVKYGDWKSAQAAAQEMVAEAHGDKNTAAAHYEFAWILFTEASRKHKDDLFQQAHDEFGKALAVYPAFPDALFLDGKALANLHRDDEAKSQFQQYLKIKRTDSPDYLRAVRYIQRPELARSRMAPPFALTTVDGVRISMDDLQGKVVLIDFWATWCQPCREALPHIQKLAKKFKGEPLLILSISLDTDAEKWKEFIAKNEMTWPQYYDGGFAGPIAKAFSVNAIPHTFTVDADSVLQDEHVGDASIEGKIKKLIAQARESRDQTDTAK